MKNIPGFCIVVAVLSGCASLTGISPDYPEDWPPVAASPGVECADLSGIYQNLATYSYLPMTGANSLAFRLLGEMADSDSVVLVYSSATLRVEARSNKGPVKVNVLSKDKGDFSCSEGAFVLPGVIHSDADGTGGYRSESRLYLRRAEGGALIGEERSSGIGAAFWLIPVAGWQTFWYQWGEFR